MTRDFDCCRNDTKEHQMTTTQTPGPKYPEIEVQLTGRDGNAFAILGIMQRSLRRAGVAKEEVAEFMTEATVGDYDHLLATCMRWVDVS